jgi:Fe2+ or Zn2+ uptake regulation protein
MNKPRYSEQRETILQIILKADKHLLAEEIHKKAQKKIPNISLGTVYRNLNQLKELKQISDFQGPSNLYFEAYTEPHHHFICEKCEKIDNLTFPTINICKSCVAPKAPFEVKNVTMTIYGNCENCRVESTKLNILK